jgi:hypothetical protein
MRDAPSRLAGDGFDDATVDAFDEAVCLRPVWSGEYASGEGDGRQVLYQPVERSLRQLQRLRFSGANSRAEARECAWPDDLILHRASTSAISTGLGMSSSVSVTSSPILRKTEPPQGQAAGATNLPFSSDVGLTRYFQHRAEDS